MVKLNSLLGPKLLVTDRKNNCELRYEPSIAFFALHTLSSFCADEVKNFLHVGQTTGNEEIIMLSIGTTSAPARISIGHGAE